MGAQFPITPAGATSPFDLKLRPGDHPEIVALMRTIARQPRRRLEAAVELLLFTLDAMDGDPDLEAICDDDEPNGDEQDGNFAEDDGAARAALIDAGPGCIISDNDFEDDGQERREHAHSEWG